MEFIKRNLFLVVIGVVTVIAVTILLIIAYSKGSTVSAKTALREQVTNELENLAQSKANFLTVQAEERRVKAVKQRAREVRGQMVEWNSKRFDMLKVPKRDTDKKVEMVPAFPIDHDLYKAYALRFVVTKKYIEELHGLLKELDATPPPTDEEIQAEVDKARRRLEVSGRGKAINPARSRVIRPGGIGPDRRDLGPGGIVPRDRPIPRAPELSGRDGGIVAPTMKGVTKSAEEQASRQGFETAVLSHSRAGVTYATLDSFDMVFPVEMVGAKDVELWHSLVNLWVQKDIVSAIRQTNDIALRRDTANPKRPQVSSAAIKRLVSVDVDENYYILASTGTNTRSGKKTKGKSKPSRGHIPRDMGLSRDNLRPDMMPPGGRDYGGGYPGQYGGTGRTSAGTTSKGEKEIALTGRSTNRKFDVIHYNFTVIMPTRYLTLLMKNLQSRSYHTILKVELAAPEAESTRSGRQVKSQALGDRYYFGTDPVMKVTIYGEFVMLSDWSRGRWDPDKVIKVGGRKKKGAWSDKYPPLMPVAVLKDLQARNQSVLRPEDMARLRPAKKKRY